MLCGCGCGRLNAFQGFVCFLPLVVVVRAPDNIFCTLMLCASRNFPLSLSHSMLAPGSRSSTLFSLFPSFSVRSFPCFCTSQSLYFLRIRFPSVDFLYNSYALFVCLCLPVIRFICMCSVRFCCPLFIFSLLPVVLAFVCLRSLLICLFRVLYLSVFDWLFGWCCASLLHWFSPLTTLLMSLCAWPSNIVLCPCLSLLFCLQVCRPRSCNPFFLTCVSPLQCAPLCCASLHCCSCLLPVLFSPPLCFNSPLCPSVFVCRSACVLHLPPPCFFPVPFRFASPCCAASPMFLFFRCCSLSLSSASPGLFAFPACVCMFPSCFSFQPLSFLCVPSPVCFASPFEKCLCVCRLSSFSFCFTSPLCADAAPCAALDLSSTDNHRDNIEGRTLMVQLVRLMQVTHHDSCACVVFKPSLEPQLLSCRV